MYRCCICGRDIDAMGLDNVSPVCGHPICEICIEIFEEDEDHYLQLFAAEDEEEM